MVAVILVPPVLPNFVYIIHRRFLVPYRASFKLNKVKMGLTVRDSLNWVKPVITVCTRSTSVKRGINGKITIYLLSVTVCHLFNRQ